MPERISTYIIGVIFSMIVVVGGVYILGDVVKSGTTTLSAEDIQKFNTSFNMQNDVNKSVSEIQTQLLNADPEYGKLGGLTALANVAWAGLKSVFTSFAFVTNMLGFITTYFGIPSFITGLLALVIVVIIAFSIYSAIFQREV